MDGFYYLMYYCKIVILLKRQLAPMMVWHNDEGVILVCRSGVRLPAIHCDVAWLFTHHLVYTYHLPPNSASQRAAGEVCMQ